jgi:hypothetical protein
MGRRLASAVHVEHPKTHEWLVLQPGEEPDEDVAEAITNPDCWESDDGVEQEPADDPATEPETEPTPVPVPEPAPERAPETASAAESEPELAKPAARTRTRKATGEQ